MSGSAPGSWRTILHDAAAGVFSFCSRTVDRTHLWKPSGGGKKTDVHTPVHLRVCVSEKLSVHVNALEKELLLFFVSMHLFLFELL